MREAVSHGTVKIWQDDPGYVLFALRDLAELPPRAQGVFVLLAGLSIVLLDVIDQIYSPAKAIERATVRPDVKRHEPTHVAFLANRTWVEALDESRRLHAFYSPLIPTRVR